MKPKHFMMSTQSLDIACKIISHAVCRTCGANLALYWDHKEEEYLIFCSRNDQHKGVKDMPPLAS